jgi:hypothetical protein
VAYRSPRGPRQPPRALCSAKQRPAGLRIPPVTSARQPAQPLAAAPEATISPVQYPRCNRPRALQLLRSGCHGRGVVCPTRAFETVRYTRATNCRLRCDDETARCRFMTAAKMGSYHARNRRRQNATSPDTCQSDSVVLIRGVNSSFQE